MDLKRINYVENQIDMKFKVILNNALSKTVLDFKVVEVQIQVFQVPFFKQQNRLQNYSLVKY